MGGRRYLEEGEEQKGSPSLTTQKLSAVSFFPSLPTQKEKNSSACSGEVPRASGRGKEDNGEGGERSEECAKGAWGVLNYEPFSFSAVMALCGRGERERERKGGRDGVCLQQPPTKIASRRPAGGGGKFWKSFWFLSFFRPIDAALKSHTTNLTLF